MRSLFIAPHADDELLGCGGTMLRRQAGGGAVGWLLVTSMDSRHGWPSVLIEERRQEIEQVRAGLGIERRHLYQLEFSAARLDEVPTRQLVEKIAQVFTEFQPEEVLIPHPSDVHSDHRVVSEAAVACTKWFRHPSVRRVLAYETVSETDFALGTRDSFCPTVFVDISPYIERKVQLIRNYRSELGSHPFPRSEMALRALATVRGAQSGFESAEAFQLLRERE